MAFQDTQNPGIGGLAVLTPAELSFLTSLAGISYSTGDIIYYNGSALTKLGIGTSGQILEVSGGIPNWSSTVPGNVSSVLGTMGRITTTPTTGEVVVDISASYGGQTSITTLGTIATGVWNGTTIAIADGGTGQTTANTSFNALVPSQGGNSGKFLTTDGTNTSWVTVSGGSGITIGITTITSGTNTRILFNDSGVVGESTNMTFDKTNQLLTIGKKIQVGNSSSVSTATPTELNMGGTYADTVDSSKAKWKLYDDGTPANIFGIGITSGQFNFFTSTTSEFHWYHGTTEMMKLSGAATTVSTINSPLALLPAGAYLTIGTATSTSTATPVYMDLGGTYADTVTSTKAKWKLYNDGTAANTYGIGISVGQLNFFKSVGGTYNWYFNDVEKMRLTGSGQLGILQTSPTALLHLGAGTATASTAPLKFTSGTNLTAIENGAVEYDGTDYFASAQSTRQKLHKGLSGSFSGVGTATTTFTVTFGGTQPNSTYKVNVTPTATLSAALFYVNNKTTTTFDVVYLAGLTGTVTFDWVLYQ